jgi:hypothetical protein
LAQIDVFFLSENIFDGIHKLSGGVGYNGVSFSFGWCLFGVRIFFFRTGSYSLGGLGLNFSKGVTTPGSYGLIFRDGGARLF